nr:murein transglycosylase domain-containing protein [Ningiella sp. W23]
MKAQVGSVKQLLAALESVVGRKWGKQNTQQPSAKKYVKYSNDYQARAIIDFEQGTVKVETIALKNTISLLQQAIVMTLLTSSDPDKTDIFTSEAPILEGEPFLYQQVLDQDKLPIKYSWRANRFARYLVNNNLKSNVNMGMLFRRLVLI